MEQEVLRQEIDKLEAQIKEWEPKTVSLSSRLAEIEASDAVGKEEYQKLIAEYPTLDLREKGEAFRRLFKKVTLFWTRAFHPAIVQKGRPRKTDRPGRNSFTLQRDLIQWDFEDASLAGSS